MRRGPRFHRVRRFSEQMWVFAKTGDPRSGDVFVWVCDYKNILEGVESSGRAGVEHLTPMPRPLRAPNSHRSLRRSDIHVGLAVWGTRFCGNATVVAARGAIPQRCRAPPASSFENSRNRARSAAGSRLAQRPRIPTTKGLEMHRRLNPLCKVIIAAFLALTAGVFVTPQTLHAQGAISQPAGDPTGATTGTAADVPVKDPKNPTLTEVMDAVGHNRIAINFVWTLLAGFLVMFMQAGFAMVETGFTRAKNAAHTMCMNFMIYS